MSVPRVVARLQNLPSISLPTDYPRPTGGTKLIEADYATTLSEQTSLGLLKLALYEDESEEDDVSTPPSPSTFHLVLSAFIVLLHRYTGDSDIVIGSSSPNIRDPLILRTSVEPTDPFWSIVRKVQQAEKEVEEDNLPYETIINLLGRSGDDADGPLFRVRFFDETDQTKDHFLRTTSLTSDMTIYISRHVSSTSLLSSRSSIAPRVGIRIVYNSLLFMRTRIIGIIEQLAALVKSVANNPLRAVGSAPLRTQGEVKVLPNPTADLNWCDFKGAITDVFSANARKWPDRPCVIQSLPASNLDVPQEKRVFTYGTIQRAANILAHQLIHEGIKREDVVMVYAHRSVDLVVAVMAVLKAGAVFSVIGKPLI